MIVVEIDKQIKGTNIFICCAHTRLGACQSCLAKWYLATDRALKTLKDGDTVAVGDSIEMLENLISVVKCQE